MNARSRPVLSLRLLVLAPLALAACREPKVTSYKTAKETEAPAAAGMPASHPPVAPGATAPAPATAAPAGGAMAATAVPTGTGASLAWTAPAHWQSKAGSSMRKGTYAITGEGGATAELAITAFPGDVGGEVANVNRWRGQVQLTPVSEAEATKAIQRISANGLAIGVVDLANPSLNPPGRMLGAMVPFDGATWFFKLTGSDALVTKEKGAFLDFVKTLKPAAP
jgi:hypothetical protein